MGNQKIAMDSQKNKTGCPKGKCDLSRENVPYSKSFFTGSRSKLYVSHENDLTCVHDSTSRAKIKVGHSNTQGIRLKILTTREHGSYTRAKNRQ